MDFHARAVASRLTQLTPSPFEGLSRLFHTDDAAEMQAASLEEAVERHRVDAGCLRGCLDVARVAREQIGQVLLFERREPGLARFVESWDRRLRACARRTGGGVEEWLRQILDAQLVALAQDHCVLD